MLCPIQINITENYAFDTANADQKAREFIFKMTRLVEDSDSELPDLAVIIGNHGGAVESKTIRRSPRKTPATKPIPNEAVIRLQSAAFHTPSENFRSSKQGFEKPKSKKRILNKTCDNPLLLPFDHQKENTLALPFSKRSELQSKVLPMRSKGHGEPKSTSYLSLRSASEKEEEDEVSMEDSTGLSDFIVNDSSSLEEDSADEEIQSRPPSSTRRLVRGRRPPGGDTSQEVHSRPINDSRSEKDAPPSKSKPVRCSDDGKESLQISNVGLPCVIPRGGCVVTPPSSPQKTQRRLLSPKKGPRIPMTPHRPSADAFWDQDVINEWNEEYSPRKTPKPQQLTSGDSFEINLSTSPSKKKQSVGDPKKYEAKKSFALKKHDIAEAFLRELDESVTDGKVSEMATLTGGVKIIWSKKLNTTAGRANWKRETMRSTTRGLDGNPEPKITYRHYASIELAEKVIDDEERLLNVIAHEFCHLANFMVSGIRNNPHGKEFKAWAAKCSQQFGDRGIHVTTKHSYDIDYKYAWECTNCGTEFKRHSKSIDPLKHQCGSCKSKLVQTKPVPRPNAVVNEYQLFVKENMRKAKEQNPGSPQKQIMTMVGRMYQEHKASKLGGIEVKADAVDVGDEQDVGSREPSLDDSQVDLVMRKLNFLDLTRP
jgi:predicted SprT family Zn-dependent metalloprotease